MRTLSDHHREQIVCSMLGVESRRLRDGRSSALGALLALTVLLQSCTTYGPWISTSDAGPLVAGEQSVATRREWVSYALDDRYGAPQYEISWLTKSGIRVSQERTAAAVALSLLNTRQAQSWPESDLIWNGVVQRIAPFTMTLISVDPTVLLLEECPVPDIEGMSVNMINREMHGGDVDMPGLLNGLNVGTSLRGESRIWWYSPELATEPESLDVASESLDLPRTSIVLRRATDHRLTVTIRDVEK